MSTLQAREADAGPVARDYSSWQSWNASTAAIAKRLGVDPAVFPSPPYLVAALGPNPRDAR